MYDDIAARYRFATLAEMRRLFGADGDLQFWHNLLANTDHIPNKLIEAPDAEREALREQCADILAARAEARAKINELEGGQE